LLSLPIVGCGGSTSSERSVAASKRGKLIVRSPAVAPLHTVPSHYGCRKNAVWLPLEWSQVPAGTKELVLVTSLSRFKTSGGTSKTSDGGPKAKLAGVSALAGLGPDLRQLRVGQKPVGSYRKAHLSPLCPSRSTVSGMVFVVYAMPFRQHLRRIPELELSDLEGLQAEAVASGSLRVLYGRPRP